MLALCHPFGFLGFYAFFACLPTCSCMSLCVVHTPIQWSYGHSIQTYICPPRTPLLFDNMLLYPFHVLHMFVCSCLASLLACSLHALPISFFCFFACLLACFFGHCMYIYGVRTLGARVWLPRHKQKGHSLVYFLILCDSIVHDACFIYIYIYIYLLACVWVIVHFVWWTLVAMWATLSSHECSWPYSILYLDGPYPWSVAMSGIFSRSVW